MKFKRNSQEENRITSNILDVKGSVRKEVGIWQEKQ